VTAGRRGSAGAVAVLLGLCALPHYLRAVLPAAALTDGFYAHAALMLGRGFAPYVDFTQVAFPLAEAVLAGAFELLGTSHRVVELVNRVVVLAVALVLYHAGRRLQSRWAGAVAALAWSWSTWVLHFNLFERETWTALGTSLALLAYFGSARIDGRRAVVVAAALVLAFVLKITAVMVAAGLCLHLALQGRLREMLRLGLTYAAGLVLVTALGAAVWGRPFLWQVYVFGFFRNQTHDLAGAVAKFANHADPTILLGLAALLLHGLPRLRRPVGALACVFAMDAVYGLGISPTLWDHNMINFVVPLSLVLGAGVDRAVSARPARDLPALALTVLGLVLLMQLGAGEARSWKPADPMYAFGLNGGRPRAWLQQRAAFVREHTGPDDVIFCIEPWIAVEAGRVKLVRYWDLEPVAVGVERSLAAVGFLETYAKRRGVLLLGEGRPPHDPRLDGLAAPYEKRLLANAVHYTRPRILEALAERELALVLEPLVPGILAPDDLLAAGYERIEDGGLAAWRAADGVVRSRVRPVFPRR